MFINSAGTVGSQSGSAVLDASDGPCIRHVEVFDVDFNHLARPHNFVLVRIHADDGTTGIGEAALIYGDGAKAAVAMLRHLAAKYLIGWPVRRTSALMHRIVRESFWAPGGGPVIWGAMSAIDQALWDILGKLSGLPVWALLGGRVRDAIPVYANGWFGAAVTPEEFAANAQKAVADGYTALKFDPWRMSATGRFAFPSQQLDDDFLRLGLARVGAVRRAVGDRVRIMLDLHGMMSVRNAVVIGQRLAEHDIFFFEDPVETLSPDWFRAIRAQVPIPIAGGDRLYTRYETRPYLEHRALDILQCDIGLSGGFTEMMRIAALAELHGVDMAPHNCAGPLNTIASLHFSAAAANVLIQELFPYWTDERYDILNEPVERRGHRDSLPVPSAPGLGASLNDDFLSRFERFEINQPGWRTQT